MNLLLKLFGCGILRCDLILRLNNCCKSTGLSPERKGDKKFSTCLVACGFYKVLCLVRSIYMRQDFIVTN